MAALDTTRPIATATATGGLMTPLMKLYAAFAAWHDARATRRALKQLNTHQLEDIGMTSAAIDLFVAKYR